MNQYLNILLFGLLVFGGCEIPRDNCDGNNTTQIFDECYSIENTDTLKLFFEDYASIPIEIKDLINLTYLSMNGRITGGIPAWIWNMTNLTDLSIGSSDGIEIPSEIGNLNNLTHLTITESGLSGEIPSEIGNLTNLTNLTLSHNQLSGEIPSEMGNLTNLIYLTLRSNQLAGTIPEVLCSFLSPAFTEYQSEYTSGLSKDFSFDLNSLCPPYPSCIDTTWIEQQFGFDVLKHYVGTQDTTNCD